MNIIGICRFSLVGRGDWKAFKGATDEEVGAISRENMKSLFAAERMEARLKTFELLTLASLRAQTDQDFKFLVLSSDLMPEEYKVRLQTLCDTVPQAILRFFPITTVREAQRAVCDDYGIDYATTLQFRLDDDDCVCDDYIAKMRAETAAKMQGDSIFVVSVRGVMYSSMMGTQDGVYDWPVDFFSVGTGIRHPSKSIYQFGHFGMATRFANVVIKDRLSLVTHNGTNDTQLTADLLKRRGMVPLSNAEVDENVAKFFPFLTQEARDLAGLNRDLPESAPRKTTRGPIIKAAPLPAPQWLDDLVTSENNNGFYISADEFALQHTYRSAKVLYVSFDDPESASPHPKHRDPWGYDVAQTYGWSHLGVLCQHANWFRPPQIFDELSRLANSGFFANFDKIVFVGSSMGAYAACAYSTLVPGSTVIAFRPQATLAPGQADWDTRYPSGSAADWTGPLANAADSLKTADKVWIVYDPKALVDKKHAALLAGPNVTLLHARHSSEFTAQYLRQIEVLGLFINECVSGDMTEARFYQLYRKGRDYRRYLVGLVGKAIQHPSIRLRVKLATVLHARNRTGLAADIEKSLAITEDFD